MSNWKPGEINEASEVVAAAILQNILAQYRRHNWDDAKEVVENLDAGEIAQAALEEVSRFLKRPENVFINTLHGRIAKMTPDQVRMVYPELLPFVLGQPK